MKTFDRIGPSPFRPDGRTKDTNIRFAGGSELKVYGGSSPNNFRLSFSNEEGEGWWVGSSSLDQLIAELLYIRRDIQGFKDGIGIDIEIGREPAEMEVEEDDEEENDPPW